MTPLPPAGLRFRHVLAGLVLVLGTAAASSSAQEEGVVIDRVVAQVDGEVLTQSQLEFETRVLLIQLGGAEAAARPLGESALASALEVTILQRLQVREAERLNTFQVDATELDEALSRFRGQFPTPSALTAFLSRMDADETRLAALLIRGLRSDKVLDSKVRLRAQVGEPELRRAYELEVARGSIDGTYEDVRAQLRERLHRQKYQELAKVELEQLQRTGNVRRIAPFAKGSAAP